MKIKAVVFDAYGTLFDVYSIQVLAESFYPSQGADIAIKWRDKQIEYTRLITQSDPHNVSGSQYFRPFWELTRLSLVYIEWLAAAQGVEFLRPLQSSVALEKAMRILREKVAFMDQDRWLSPDIEAAATLVNSGQLSELLPSFHLVEKIH